MAYKICSITLGASATITGSIGSGGGVPSFNGTGGNVSVSLNLGPVGGGGYGSFTVEYQNPTEGLRSEYYRYATVNGNEQTPACDFPSSLSTTVSGSVAISIPCDICFDFEPLPGVTNPFFAGVVDSPGYQRLVFKLIGSGNATVDVTFDGSTGSSSTDVQGVQITPSIEFSATVQCNGSTFHVSSDPNTFQWVDGLASIALSVTTNVPSTGLVGSAASYSYEFPAVSNPEGNFSAYTTSASASADAGGVSASGVNTTSVGPDGGAPNASGTASWSASRSFSISGLIRAMEQPYPDTLTLSCPINGDDPDPTFTASSSFSRSGTQQVYSTNATASAASKTNSASNFNDISVTIDSASLAANGDDEISRRVFIHGRQTQGMSLAQAASFLFEDMSDSSAWSGTGTDPDHPATVSVASNVLTIVASGLSIGGATRSYSPVRSMAGYRYLQVPVMSVGSSNQSISLACGGYSWAIETGDDGVWVTREIDLCTPTGTTADAWDTHWPNPYIDSPGATTGLTSGPYYLDSMSIESVPAGATIEVGQMTQVYHNAATVDCLPTLYPSVYSDTIPLVAPPWPLTSEPSRSVGDGGSSQAYVRRGMMANTDGRQTVEEGDMGYTYIQPESSSDSYIFSPLLIQDLCSSINGVGGTVLPWPGWSAAAAVAYPGEFTSLYSNGNPIPAPVDPYYNNAGVLTAAEVYGSGAVFVYGTGWTYGFDLPIATIAAQPLYDTISMCGMEGDAFGHGGGAIGAGPDGSIAPLTLVAHAMLRAGAHGLILDETSDAPVEGATADLLQGSPAAVVSVGTSRSDGWYHTSSDPYAHALQSGSVAASISSTPLSLGTLYTRHRHRGTFFSVPSPCPTLFLGDPLSYFPFIPQFSDPSVLPTEEWRRIKAAQDTSSGSNDATTSGSTDASVQADEGVGDI